MQTKQNVCPLMYRLVLQAETDFNDDRRAERRFPFFRPASILVDGYTFSAFTRDISSSAIGLLHNVELPLKEVEIVFDGHRQRLKAQVQRCEPCGEG